MHRRISISQFNKKCDRLNITCGAFLLFRLDTVLNRYNVWRYSIQFERRFFLTLVFSLPLCPHRRNISAPILKYPVFWIQNSIQFNKNSCCIAMCNTSFVMNTSTGQCYALDDINCSILRASKSIFPFYRSSNEIQMEYKRNMYTSDALRMANTRIASILLDTRMVHRIHLARKRKLNIQCNWWMNTFMSIECCIDFPTFNVLSILSLWTWRMSTPLWWVITCTKTLVDNIARVHD